MDLHASLPEPNLEQERTNPLYQRVLGEVAMIDRLLNSVSMDISPQLKPLLINIAKRLELTAMDIKAKELDTVKPVTEKAVESST